MGADFWSKILDILCYAMFPGSIDRVTRILGAFYVAGLWGVFVKCGLKGWWALVPVIRENHRGMRLREFYQLHFRHR